MTIKYQEETVLSTYRVPKSTRERVRKHAGDENRSESNMVVRMLEEGCTRRERKPRNKGDGNAFD